MSLLLTNLYILHEVKLGHEAQNSYSNEVSLNYETPKPVTFKEVNLFFNAHNKSNDEIVSPNKSPY